MSAACQRSRRTPGGSDMPRAMWKGAISFGLVTIPVSVYPATEEKSVKFNQLHEKDQGRIRYKRVCSVDGEEVPYDEIVKGYEYEKDHYVTMSDEDFDAVPVESSRAIDIHQFVELSEIDPMLYKKSYYLVPEETGAKAYTLLREAMAAESKVGIAKVSFRDKEHLAALRFVDDAFVLETMFWPDEIRGAEFEGVDVDAKVRSQELEMAKQLIDNLTADWNPEEYRDEYREAMLEIVEKKIAGEEIEVVPQEAPAKVVDLMEALKASVAAAKSGDADEEAPTGPEKSAARAKSSAKKSGAKKPAAKKPAAKKTAAKKATTVRKKAVGE
jgi:DNA end-binding protein Ku